MTDQLALVPDTPRFTPRATTSLRGRFETKYAVDEQTGCWNWTGCRSQGYGQIREGGRGSRMLAAHRVSHEIFIGPIPDGLQVDHLCRNTLCVNPEHLEAVTGRENTMRGATITARNAAKTHCAHGHPFSGANLMTLPSGERRCRTCSRDASRRWRERSAA